MIGLLLVALLILLLFGGLGVYMSPWFFLGLLLVLALFFATPWYGRGHRY